MANGFDKILNSGDLQRLDTTIFDFGIFTNGKLGYGNKPVTKLVSIPKVRVVTLNTKNDHIMNNGFDKTLNSEDLHRLDSTICDFGTFANGKLGCGNKPVIKPKEPAATSYSYVAAGYVVDGYFTTSTSQV